MCGVVRGVGGRWRHVLHHFSLSRRHLAVPPLPHIPSRRTLSAICNVATSSFCLILPSSNASGCQRDVGSAHSLSHTHTCTAVCTTTHWLCLFLFSAAGVISCKNLTRCWSKKCVGKVSPRTHGCVCLRVCVRVFAYLFLIFVAHGVYSI